MTKVTELDYSPPLIRRLAARAIDFVLLAAVGAGLGQLIGFGYDWLAITAAFVLVYSAGFLALFGATPGKWMFGIHVVGPDGARPPFSQSLARELFTVIGAVPYAGPLLALVVWTWIIITIRSSPLGQGKHDSLAGGTLAVRVRRREGATQRASRDAFAEAHRP